MQLLLGELPVKSGNVIINGSVSYAAQKPWLFTGTVRANILFGQVYDKKRYGEVNILTILFFILSNNRKSVFLFVGGKILCFNNRFRTITKR